MAQRGKFFVCFFIFILIASKKTSSAGLPFTCQICGKAFKSLKGRKAHITVKHGGRSTEEPESGGDKQQQQQADAEELPFPCSACGKTFDSAKGRNVHRTKLHGRSPEKSESDKQPVKSKTVIKIIIYVYIYRYIYIYIPVI